MLSLKQSSTPQEHISLIDFYKLVANWLENCVCNTIVILKKYFPATTNSFCYEFFHESGSESKSESGSGSQSGSESGLSSMPPPLACAKRCAGTTGPSAFQHSLHKTKCFRNVLTVFGKVLTNSFKYALPRILCRFARQGVFVTYHLLNAWNFLSHLPSTIAVGIERFCL